MNNRTIYRTMMAVVLLFFGLTASAQSKREFRGAWIQCVNGQFEGMPTKKMQETLSYQLDELQKDGCNVIIFQVRPECDALYESNIEPWSRFLTGTQGKAPSPYWDPLQWMIIESHKRGMELHAWINPYRAKTKGTKALASNHIINQHPDWAFDYDGLKVLNPALKENRDFICSVVRDIVSRYDVDGLHIDDYFYPYPVAGLSIPDEDDFRRSSNGFSNKNDWRRYNVDLFIKQLSETIHQTKPWVKFGVSPFGIYRNKKSAANGSNTNGLQNYDDLYADVLLWINNGWLDYCVPQIYWEIGNKAADYDELIHWWNRNCTKRPLVIGEDVERTVKYPDPNNPQKHQLEAKMQLHHSLPYVKGTVLWYAKAAVDNVGNYGTLLRTNYWRNPALQPDMSFLGSKAPGKVKSLKPVWVEDGYVLFWTAPKAKKDWQTTPTKYVVYAFKDGEKVNVNNSSNIIAITSDTYFKLPYNDGKTKYTYVVTSLNRIHNESKVAKRKVKL